jgi:hypothetical protein
MGRTEEKRKLMTPPLVLLMGEVAEAGVADEVVEVEAEGMVGTLLLETKHGKTRIRLAKATTIGNAVMTRRWPGLDDTLHNNVHPPNASTQYMNYIHSRRQSQPRILSQ